MARNFRVFITNLGKYNEGELVGKWLDLPCDDIESELASIGVVDDSQYEEYFITDYENDWDYVVDKYESLEELNELAEQLANVDSCGNGDWLCAFMEAEGGSLEDALDNYENVAFYPEMSLEDLARDIVKEQYNLPEDVEKYFDYEAYARDLSYEGYTETEYGVIAN